MANDYGTLDDAYYTWLYSLVASVQNRNPANSHWELLKVLYSTRFEGYVPNDDNRSFEGKDLRFEFLSTTGYPLVDPYGLWFDLECSMLEMIIALSRKAAYQDELEGEPVEWFWRMMHNLGLEKYTDDLFEISIQEEVEYKLDRVNKRTYETNGLGGLFPLKNPREDQRKVELWTQLSAYLLEGEYANTKPQW